VAGSGGAPDRVQTGHAAEGPWRMGGSSRTRGASPANPGAATAAKTVCITGSGKRQRPRTRPRVPAELWTSPVVPWEAPSCGFSSISSPVLTHPQAPLLLAGFSPSLQGIQTAIACFQQLHVQSNPLTSPHRVSLSPITSLSPQTRAAAGTEQPRCIKREKLDLVLRALPGPAGLGLGPEPRDGLLAWPYCDVLRHVVAAKQQMQNLAPPIPIFIFFITSCSCLGV